MKGGSSTARHISFDLHEFQHPEDAGEQSVDEVRARAARKIAVEAKKLWREAQASGLDDIAKLMEECFYRAYREAGGPKAMRAV